MQKNDINEKTKYYIRASYLINVQPIVKSALFEYFEYDIERFWNMNKENLNEFSNLNPHIKIPNKLLENITKINDEKAEEKILNSDIDFFTYDDKIYPELLKQIPDFPLILYFRGNLRQELFENTLAIVGSRKASEEAKINVSRIIKEMKGTDITIVSGLAMGIDGIAHNKALENNLKTIGVIASGHNYTYPSVNKYLYEEIVKENLILSEFPPETPPQNYYFPQRNRIVTGISFGTLVGEAALKSGAMISANLALEQGRELFCIPGSLLNKNTEGVYKLLKSGATIVTEAKDIFDGLLWEMDTKKINVETTNEEKNILETLSIEAKSIENIAEITKYDAPKLMVLLTSLELKGLIKQIGGKYFITG